MNDTTPVVVGVAELTQRIDGPDDGLDAVDLLSAAIEAAFVDAGGSGLAVRTGLIAVPLGTWHHPDPGRVAGGRIGAPGARTLIGDIGILQQTLLSRACRAVAAGEVEVAVVAGAETKRRDGLRARAGLAGPPAGGPDGPGGPDEFVRPHGDVLSALEIERLLAVPAHQYALVESVLAHRAGRSPHQQRDAVGKLWARFAEVAAGRQGAWDRSAPDAASIADPTPPNRMIATPYTRSMCSQWNVDQAAALVICSAAAARAAGIGTDRWVFPVAAAESNHMATVPARHSIADWPAFAAVADALFAAGTDAVGSPLSVGDVELIDLYSCFPAAVQVQAATLDLDLDLDRTLTVTGGMTFGGGPLNSYQLHAVVELARRLRAAGGNALSTAVSGMLTKPGASLWSSTPPVAPFRAVDVTAAVARDAREHPVAGDLTGPAVVIGATVVHQPGWPDHAVVVATSTRPGDGEATRTVATSDDPAVVAAFEDTDWVDGTIDLVAPGRFTPGSPDRAAMD